MRSALGYSARGEGTDTLELDIYDIVGRDWWGDGVSAQSFRRTLKASSAKTIKLRINSEGGDVFDGFAIYNLLKDHPARVEADVDALAASIASVILMAADEIRIASNAFVMIHNPWGGVYGTPDELRNIAELLEKMRDNAADIYAARTGQSREKCLELMEAETWMTATEALKLGFVDKVVPLKASSSVPAKATARAFACMSLDEYSNVPDGLRATVEAARAARNNKTTSPAGPADSNPDPGEGNANMEDTLKAFLTAAGLKDSAELNARLGLLAKLSALTGKSGDEALGTVAAWKASHEALPGVQTQLATQQASLEAQELDAAFAEAKKEDKVTPAYEAELRRQLGAKETTLAAVKATLKMLHPVKALAAAKGAPGAGAPVPVVGEDLKLGGKTYAELKPFERVALKRDNPELYEAMRAANGKKTKK